MPQNWLKKVARCTVKALSQWCPRLSLFPIQFLLGWDTNVWNKEKIFVDHLKKTN